MVPYCVFYFNKLLSSANLWEFMIHTPSQVCVVILRDLSVTACVSVRVYACTYLTYTCMHVRTYIDFYVTTVLLFETAEQRNESTLSLGANKKNIQSSAMHTSCQAAIVT